MNKKCLCIICLQFITLMGLNNPAWAEYVKKPVPAPTWGHVPYGADRRNVLDFWQASSDAPTPLVLVIHGGGWNQGKKEFVGRIVDVDALLKAGISVAAINYRFIKPGLNVKPPVKAPMHDAARALQFIRSKAEVWNLDKDRIGAAGSSAGACTALWLLYRDDLADPASEDAGARESTRLFCAAVKEAQTSLDPKQMKEWIPNITYGGHAFGLGAFPNFLAARERILPWIEAFSPYAWVSPDDPPAYLFYSRPPAVGQLRENPTHSSNFGVKLQERCRELGADCILTHPGSADAGFQSLTDYLVARLKAR